MADHKRFTLATDIDVFFCDPQSPWQRGSNENTNGLLRQYFPKGMDLSIHSQTKLNAVAKQLKERPRKTLNFETPAERFSQCVASIDWNRSIKRNFTKLSQMAAFEVIGYLLGYLIKSKFNDFILLDQFTAFTD